MRKEYDVTPVPKPRMTQRDRWAKRPAVIRYRDFCDTLRELGLSVSNGGTRLEFTMPMPKSWSQKKRAEMNGKPHMQKPDIDNLIKAVFDATREDDSGIYEISAIKIWGETGKIAVID